MGYPEWVRGVPSRDCPWNDDSPDYMCENCDFYADDVKSEWITKKEDAWICPDCGHRNPF